MRTLIALVALSTVVATAQSPCGPSVDLVVGASQPGVTGLVERQVVASNPFPWGRSVSVIVRFWGGGRVEKWVVSGRGDDCTLPRRPVGSLSYHRLGGGSPELLRPVRDEISPLEIAAVQNDFGPPERFAVSIFDRAMATLRVFPSVPLAALVVLTSAASLARRRRRRRSDRYLF